jgi:hypothetical protein
VFYTALDLPTGMRTRTSKDLASALFL